MSFVDSEIMSNESDSEKEDKSVEESLIYPIAGNDNILSEDSEIDEGDDLFQFPENAEEVEQKQSFCNLLVQGKYEKVETDEDLVHVAPPEYYKKRNIWTCFGLLGEKNIGNCFGVLGHRRNFYDCFGFRNTSGKLGWFMGVFVPVILDCFGVIIFLRLPMIVGNGGIILAIVLFTLGYVICVLTVCSATAIASSGEMGDGGSYYMISRTLGPLLGGSIGFILFFANVAGTALYVIGFCDTLDHAFPAIEESLGSYGSKLLIGSFCLFCIAVIVFIGASLFSKCAFLVFIVLLSSIIGVVLSFGGILYFDYFSDELKSAKEFGYEGWNWDTFSTNLFPYHDKERYELFSFQCNDSKIDHILPIHLNESVDVDKAHCSLKVYEQLSSSDYGIDQETGERLNFESLFAIFFPAVTGVLAGTNLSGDLKNPSKAISRGTFFGIIFSYIIYVTFIVIIGATTNREDLVTNYDIIMEITFSEVFIKIGMFCATISSAMTSLIGSSRILYALARDNIFPLLGICSITFKNEPRVALIFTFILCQFCLFFGNLDVIAPFMTLFFVFTFAITNFACFLLSVLEPPNFKPSVKYFSWWSCLLGCIISIFMMFYMNYIMTFVCLIATAIIMAIILCYTKIKPKERWGNIFDAVLYFISTQSILKMMRRKKYHRKYWSFKGLLLIKNVRSQLPLIKFVDQFSSKRGGLCILGNIFKTPKQISLNEERTYLKIYEKQLQHFNSLVDDLKLSMFPSILLSSSLRKGIQNMILSSGVGAVRPTCIFLGWFEKDFNISFTPNIYHLTKKETVALQRFKHTENNDESNENNNTFLNIDEYMNIFKDILLMKKSLIIGRNFRNFDSRLLKPFNLKYLKCCFGVKNRYVDMWIFVNGETSEDFMEPSISLILQLGYLLNNGTNSVFRRYHKLRILAIDTEITDCKEYKYRLNHVISKLGMSSFCEVEIVKVIEEDYEFLYDEIKKERNTRKLEDQDEIIITEEEEEENNEEIVIEDQEENQEENQEEVEEITEVQEEKEEEGGEEVEEDEKLSQISEISETDENYIETVQIPSVYDNSNSNNKEEFELKDINAHEMIKRSKSTFTFELRKSVSFDNNTIPFLGRTPIVSIPEIDDWDISSLHKMKILNNIINRNSQKTSIMYIPLPPPPFKFEKEQHEQYYKELEILTNTSIPTFLVHSHEKVLYLYI